MVKDPHMTRILMYVTEHVDLVEHALSNVHPSNLFVRKAQAAIMRDLASAMTRFFGAHPANRVIGSGYGESLYASILGAGEIAKAKGNVYHYHVSLDTRFWDYTFHYEKGELGGDNLHHDCTARSVMRFNVQDKRPIIGTLPEVPQRLGGNNS